MGKSTLPATRQTIQRFFQLFLAAVLAVLFAGRAVAQDYLARPVSVSVNQTEITKIISILEGQAKIKFVYSPKAINAGRRITCSASNKKLGAFLDDIFRPLDISYKPNDDQIILYSSQVTKQNNGLTAVSNNSGGAGHGVSADAGGNTGNTTAGGGEGGPYIGSPEAGGKTPPPPQVTGFVKDDKGAFLQGVSVTEKGTNNSTSTNASGKFTITLTSTNPVLVFSFSGFASKEVVVGNQTVINTDLISNAKGLDEVVVVGYGRQKKINNTGAIATIGTKELVQSPVANISNSLVGRLPGLFATQVGGEPGNDASTIRIRGVATFSGNTNPLYLVDGIEVSNYNNIDPNEIESLTILKDASSTAVYGIRGANGVIIITTKRGKNGPPKISYSYNQGFNSFTNLRTSMNAADYATAWNAALKADAYSQNTTYNPKFTPTDIELYQNGKDPIFHPNHNWFEELFRKVASQSQHNLNVSGGSGKVRYFVSGGFFNQQGLFKDLRDMFPDFNTQSTYRRYNIRSNFNFDVSKRFKIALDLSSQTEIRNGNSNVNGTERVIGDIARASPLDGPGVVDGKIVNINTTSNNPYSALLFPNKAGGSRRFYRNYINGSLRADEDLGFLVKGLSVHGLLGLQTYNTQDIANTKVVITYMAYPINGGPINGGTVNYVPDNTESAFGFSAASTYSRRVTLEGGIDYKRSFGNHNITALALYNQQKTYDPTFQFLVPRGYQSMVGRLTYDYQSRYLAEVNVGYNGSENFAPGKRFGFFPAYSIGWVPSLEPFFPRQNVVSFLKFRASYGEVGYDQIGGNRFLYNPTSYTTYGSIYYFGNIGTNFAAYNGLREGATGNPNVTWERAKKADIGVDMRLLQDKLSVTADIFEEKRNNILALPQTITSVVGLTQPSTNLGRMQNKGYEGEVTYSDRVGKVNYRISANYSFARNKVIYRDEIPPAFSYQATTGQRLGQNFALICDGIFNTWDEVNDAKRPVYQNTAGNRVQPGDLKFRDINGDGIINSFDQVPVGYSIIPEKTFGVSLSANYKGFDVSVLFQGVGNVSTYYSRFQRNAGFGENPATGAPAYLNESWTPERYAAGLPINFPRFSAVTTQNSAVGSTFFLADASYLRLKNAEIGYSLRPAVLKRMNISSIRLYANANNLITWRHTYKGIDPENTSTGDTNTEPYPLVRTINVGLNVNF